METQLLIVFGPTFISAFLILQGGLKDVVEVIYDNGFHFLGQCKCPSEVSAALPAP